MLRYRVVYICPKCKVCLPLVWPRGNVVCPDCGVKMAEMPITHKEDKNG